MADPAKKIKPAEGRSGSVALKKHLRKPIVNQF
jgi:hypothetical protein